MNDWIHRAACAGHDTETWFPDRYTGRRHATQIEAAKNVCWHSCPVRLACLTAELAAEGDSAASMRHGIRGGLDPGQRWRVQQQLAERQAA